MNLFKIHLSFAFSITCVNAETPKGSTPNHPGDTQSFDPSAHPSPSGDVNIHTVADTAKGDDTTGSSQAPDAGAGMSEKPTDAMMADKKMDEPKAKGKKGKKAKKDDKKTDDAMKGDTMKGDAMSGDAMKGDAMKDDTKK